MTDERHPLDKPFEPRETPQEVEIEAVMATACIVRACMVGAAPSALPALAFDFLLPDGKQLNTVILVGGPGDLIKMAQLVTSATLAANGQAAKANSRKE